MAGVSNIVLVRKNPGIIRPSRLAAMQKNEDVSRNETNIRFSNESPFLLISSESVKDLLGRIPDAVPYPHSLRQFSEVSLITLKYIGITSFRPNIVLSGGLAPYAEDDWEKVGVIYLFAATNTDGPVPSFPLEATFLLR